MILSRIPPTPALLFLSVFYPSSHSPSDEFRQFLTKWNFVLPPFEATTATFIDYYKKEMGEHHHFTRNFYFSSNPFARDALIDLKEDALQFESQTALAGQRTINLDPGLLCLEHFILAPTKPFTHRPHLKNSIYLELTYLYEKGEYRPLPWTYPDYQSRKMIEIFEKQRPRLLQSRS